MDTFVKDVGGRDLVENVAVLLGSMWQEFKSKAQW
jgi:hypothetical protein